MSPFETVEKVRAELSALTLDLEQVAITIAAKAGTARGLRDHAIDTLTALAASDGTVPVRQDDANRYCEILRLLGMDEEGDPVAAIRDLIDRGTKSASGPTLLGELPPEAMAALDVAAERVGARTIIDRLKAAGVWPLASVESSQDLMGNSLDLLLWRSTPIRCVPLHGSFEPVPASTSGHRYLVAADGLWLEVRRPWLHLLWPLANIGEPVKPAPGFRTNHATPFGRLNPSVEIAFGKLQDLIRSFAERGRTSCPNERSAWLSWEHGIEGAEPRLVWSEPIDACGSPGELHYARPKHTANLSPCIDLHTHGTASAFFSLTDDQDDAHDVKIAIVIGNLDQPVPTIAARLCCLGVFIPMTVKAEEIFHA
jgi:PRTRC genetic system protein A